MALVELMRTTNPAQISWLEALFRDAGIPIFVMDAHTSIMEGSIGAIPRRVMVPADDEPAARRLLADTGEPLAE